ncbi:unnamed protein product [Rhizophagus irregularis]|nr:unnamed protein product [Rhizophagus irregularis]
MVIKTILWATYLVVAQRALQQATVIQRALQQATVIHRALQQATVIQRALQQVTVIQRALQRATVVQRALQQATVIQRALQRATVIQRALQQATVQTMHLELFYDNDHLKKINRDLRRLDRLQGNNFIPNEEDGRDLVNGLLQRRREADKFNVYLFIEKLSNNRSDSSFLRFVANSVFKNKYGMFHVGLEIDGIVLEWGTGDAGPHLIYPRINTNKIYEKIAHIRVNYDSNFSREFNHSTNTFLQNWRHHMQNFVSIIKNYIIKLLNFVLKIGVVPSNKLQIIAQKCVYWNRNYYYDLRNRNCQHFINEILETLNLKFNPEGESSFRDNLDQFADQNWNMITNSWDKRLLLCYSDMMNNMYEYKYDEKWGPMNNKEKWIEREYELRTDYKLIFITCVDS